MRLLAKVIFGAAVLAGAYYVYERPEIQELFKASPRVGDPLAFLENLPEISPKPQSEPVRARRKPQVGEEVAYAPAVEEADVEESGSSPEYQNQVPNAQVSRVLMQILAAKKLAEGVYLLVTDDTISVTGEVASAEQRDQILGVIEKGREARRIESQQLKVRD